jgi:SAM-dependent methyltransferase
MWAPRFACPECSAELFGSNADVCTCARCGNRYAQANGLWHFITPPRLERLAPFLQQYRRVRGYDSRRRTSADYYRGLPWVGPDDEHASEWQIRRETFAHLLRHLLAGAPASIRILDLGAGNAWLSHRLAELGHAVVAVDALDDEADGLGASKHYRARFAAIQADYDALPLAPAQFDLVVFNGSLHYAPDPAGTIVAARRMLAGHGAIAVMDSPMFVRDSDGRAMVADKGLLEPGAGYLTFQSLDDVAETLGLRSEFIASRGTFRWRLGRRFGALRLGRAPAAFGLWIGWEREGFIRG